LRQDVSLTTIFCHPRVIKDSPTLVAYYRSLALLSQKGVSQVLGSVQTIEEGKRKLIDNELAIELATLFNTSICSWFSEEVELRKGEILLLVGLSFGTQFQGSWQNEVGTVAIHRVKE